MTTITREMRQRAAGRLWKTFISQGWFSVSDLRKIEKVLFDNDKGISKSGLTSYHVVYWEDLGPDLSSILIERALDALGVDVVEAPGGTQLVPRVAKRPLPKPPPTEAPAHRPEPSAASPEKSLWDTPALRCAFTVVLGLAVVSFAIFINR